MILLISVHLVAAEEKQLPGRYAISDVAETVSPAVVNVNTVVMEEMSPFGFRRDFSMISLEMRYPPITDRGKESVPGL